MPTTIFSGSPSTTKRAGLDGPSLGRVAEAPSRATAFGYANAVGTGRSARNNSVQQPLEIPVRRPARENGAKLANILRPCEAAQAGR